MMVLIDPDCVATYWDCMNSINSLESWGGDSLGRDDPLVLLLYTLGLFQPVQSTY